MKKTVAGFILTAILFALCLLSACHKTHNGPTNPASPAMVGNWHIDSVTTYFYDSAEFRYRGMHAYSFPGYYFNFNADSSWVETINDTLVNSGITGGTYKITSDSTFTLLNADANPNTAVEPCKIISLSNTTFIFSKQRATLFNGTDPGIIKYVFRLTK